VSEGASSTNDEQCRANVIDRSDGSYQRYEYTNPQTGGLYEAISSPTNNTETSDNVYQNVDNSRRQ